MIVLFLSSDTLERNEKQDSTINFYLLLLHLFLEGAPICPGIRALHSLSSNVSLEETPAHSPEPLDR